MDSPDVQQTVSHLFRHEAGKMAAVLTHVFGLSRLDTAEDIVQETLLKALHTWKFQGIPDNPTAWLYTVARNKARDTLRREKNIQLHHQSLLVNSEWTLTPSLQQLFLDNEIEDSQLRMIFACCHPSIPPESQITLILKTLCGLSVHEIAAGFMTSDETVAKRLYRAKEKIREEKITLEVPHGSELTKRLQVVLQSLYLLFNEGYLSTQHDSLIRQDLCEEALRLMLLLTRHPITATPVTHALTALMCFQASRFETRLDDAGSIVLLQDQDRKRWNQALIAKGQYYLNQSSAANEVSEYHLEAAIASYHALAPSFEETDWEKVVMLYDLLLRIRPGDNVRLNRAIAVGYQRGPATGIEELQQLQVIDGPYYWTALGDFHQQLKDYRLAKAYYEQALTRTASKHEQALLLRKISKTAAELRGE